MQKKLSGESRLRILSCLFVIGLLAAFIILPSQFRSEAVSSSVQVNSELPNRFEDFDIRNQSDEKNIEIEETLEQFRQASSTDAVTRADIRDAFVQGENSLKRKIPTLYVEYNRQLRNPEVIEPNIMNGGGVLERASNQPRAEILRNFATQNNDLIGMEREQIGDLKVTADYKNPEGTLSFARLEQFINDIPVFRGEIRAGFSHKGEMFRVINNLASGLDYRSLSTNFGDPAAAIKQASAYLNHDLRVTTPNKAKTTDLKAVFGEGDWATTAEKMYFPIEPGVARAAWRVLIWELGDAYYVIVDAETGKLLNRECITTDQTQAATYNVYANSDSLLKVMGNPAPVNPGLTDPNLGTQGTLQPRTNVTTIGNEAPFTFNTNGWIPDGSFNGNGQTDGNNVEAGVDRDTTNGVDATIKGTNRVFNFNYTPGAGANNGPGDDPLLPVYQNGASTNLFYVTNRYHDETYLLGFTEMARNFQQDNFGRGGSGSDRISAEAQDNTASLSCTPPCYNNANFSTPADGQRGRMQMYLWNRMTPNRDGDLDAEVIVHELTHGLFGRLHNGNSGTQAGQMNEGNSDFFAHVMLAQNNDSINNVSVTGGYVTLNLRTVFSGAANYYYGIRRFPKALLSVTGGPNNRPHNPLTFKDIDPAQMNLNDGAYAPAFAGSATAVHDGGEIWSSMMWEVRGRMVTRLGAVAGNKKVLQLAMDGMKVAPSNPTMIQERNAIISAALNNGNSADVGDVWAGFAIRGMGFSAQNPTGNTVVEGYDLPNAQVAQTGFAVSDVPGDNDGYPEPGENVLLSVPVTNVSGNTINNVNITVNGGSSTSYGTIANGQTVTMDIPFTVPTNLTCGSLYQVQIGGTSDVGAIPSATREFRVGVPVGGAPASFSSSGAVSLPGTGTSGPSNPYPSNITVSGLSGTKIIKLELTDITHSYPADLDFLLVGPGGQKYIFLSDSGGGTDAVNLNITLTDGAATQMGSAAWTSGEFRPYNTGANDAFVSPAPAAPYTNAAPAGTDTFASVFGTNGSAMNGTWSLYAVDDTNTDGGTMAGWKLTFESNDYNCSVTPTVTGNKRADFDGDGKTDMSVFRPSDGSWYINRSTDGFTATTWGQSSDTLVPADFDGDGKTDVAVFRPSNGGWYYVKSSDNSFVGSQFGQSGDIPMPGDFDGDGKADVNVFRPANGFWYRMNSANNQFVSNAFGQDGDKPLTGDFNGDGKADLAVFRPSNGFWYIAKPTGVPAQNFDAIPFGLGTDLPTPADYDGDGKTDVAVFRPSTGGWYSINSSNNQNVTVIFGQAGDIPVPGDYDGDGKYDQAIVRSGVWYMKQSTNGLAGANFGNGSDRPIPKSYIP